MTTTNTPAGPVTRRALLPVVARRVAALVSTAALAACGGGGDGGAPQGWLTAWGPADKTTVDATITLAGDAFVPDGAGCRVYSGPWAPPGCLCELGDRVRLAWANPASASSGAFPGGAGGASLGISGTGANCAPSVWWRVPDVPLAPGANLVEVRVTDGRTSAVLDVPVTRR